MKINVLLSILILTTFIVSFSPVSLLSDQPNPCTATLQWDAPEFYTITDTCDNDSSRPIDETTTTELLYDLYIRLPETSSEWVMSTIIDTSFPLLGECGTIIEFKVCAKFYDTDPTKICCTDVMSSVLSHATPGCSQNLRMVN